MTREKSIVIGCDQASTLAEVMYVIKQTSLFRHHTVTASRISDLIGIVRSLEPDLVIISFRNNQLMLNDFDTFVKKPHIPVLCLTAFNEQDTLRWSPGNIVFTYSLQQIKTEDHLCARIQSIFMLGTAYSGETRKQPLAKAAIQQQQEKGDLSRYVLELDQKVDVLQKIKEKIVSLYPKVDDHARVELISIVNTIKTSAGDNKLWEDFKLCIEQTNPGFLQQLVDRHPALTMRDLKYCCYLKMNMTNDDIKSLLGINQESVRTHKYRLKKKLALSPEDDLHSYLRSVGHEQPYLA